MRSTLCLLSYEYNARRAAAASGVGHDDACYLRYGHTLAQDKNPRLIKSWNSRRLLKICPDFLRTCSVCPCQHVPERYLYIFIYSPDVCFCFWALRNLKLSEKKDQKQTPFVNGAPGAHRTRVLNFRIYL